MSPPLELSSFGTFSGVSPGDTMVGLTVNVSQFASDIRMGPPTVELWDDSGTPTCIGSWLGTVTTSQANVDSFTYTGITYSQLATLRVRIFGQAPIGSSYVETVESASLVVNYTPSPNAAVTLGGPVTASAADPTMSASPSAMMARRSITGPAPTGRRAGC